MSKPPTIAEMAAVCRERGITISHWCNVANIGPSTVCKILKGNTGCRYETYTALRKAFKTICPNKPKKTFDTKQIVQ